MSLLNTKPRWFQDVVASDRGWINPKTGEVLIAIGNLKAKLEVEAKYLSEKYSAEALSKPTVDIPTPETIYIKRETTPVVEIVETPVEQPKEIIMETKIETPVKVKREYNKKPKVIGEVVEEKLETSRQIIGEVVEHDLDK